MPSGEFQVEDILKHLGVRGEPYKLESVGEACGFQGTYYSLTIKNQSQRYFIKTIPTGTDIVTKFYRDLGTFPKEVLIYRDIFPRMEKFAVNKLWCCYFYGKEEGFLVLQDLTFSGWKLPRVMDLDHIKVAITGLAEFHAASLALIETDSNFVEMPLPETMFPASQGKPGRQMWEAYCRVAQYIVRLYMPEYDHVDVSAVLKNAVNDVGKSRKYRNCLNHGDPWMNNMFFEYVDGSPVKCCFVDFQSARFCPPALDVSIFLFIFDPLREADLTQTYHKHLLEHLKRTKTAPLTKPEFDESLEVYKGPGIAIASLYIFLTKLPHRFLSEILISQETFIPFALGHDYSPALNALQEDVPYRQAVLDSLKRVVQYYSSL
ncbi:hypothetical protein GE061_006265 [Apolygus lucorum]|uniref:CHK kinase-like domain-containing protein n=1 Tax=Apolygus lucorum TaxID=248454 RepID=A0A8S9WTH0_APOLU|nr:hypothetical protein GE061_006265 [Apolygus lucorum]